MGREITGPGMLRELRIKNFAIMDEVTLDLGAGLNVLTGETGAGKTMVLNALSLVRGGRVSQEIIRQGEEEASVEALFDPVPEGLRAKLGESGHENEESLVIKRVVQRSGKNRIYLNGGLGPLGLLSELGGDLIHIYGQHEHHTLLKSESHLALLDSFGELEERVKEMKSRYYTLKSAWERLRHAREEFERRKRESAQLREQADEISRAQLKVGEEDELKARKEILIHAEKLYQGCREGVETLYEGEEALASRLGKYLIRLREWARIDRGLSESAELLESALAQIEEAASLLRRQSDRLQFDPEELERLEERLAEIQRLKRKYNASVEEIQGLGEKIQEELKALERGEEEIPALENAFEEAQRFAWEWAEKLSMERGRAAKRLDREMVKELQNLGMPGTVFETHFVEVGMKSDEPPFFMGGKRLSEEGVDQAEFYLSPNPGEPVRPLAKIASGGELSRLMLALKSLVLARDDVSTLLFDEVDAGIGGRVAEIVGRRLKKVAASHQVLCVTHLPQIAALADSHFVVQKETSRGRTFTSVKKLGDRDRVDEVARMLGGIKITEQTKRHAEEMIKMQGSGKGSS